MTRDRISIPQSQGGLIRYFDDYKSKLEFKPGQVIIISIIVIVLIIALHLFGKGFFGLS